VIKNISVTNIKVLILSVLIFSFFFYLSSFIDFHPDESIYFDAIPVNLNNDVGLFYHIYYGSWLAIVDKVQSARYATVSLGVILLIFSYFYISNRFKDKEIKIYFCLICLALSYQFIFLFIRVRPEAGWWFLFFFAVFSLLYFDLRIRKYFYLTFLVLMLLPMNHKLSWFPAFFIVGYMIIFIRINIGIKKTLFLCSAVFLGIFLNLVLRSSYLGLPIPEFFSSLFVGSGVEKADFYSFSKNVFYLAPNFLNDFAKNDNFYDFIFGANKSFWMSHEFVQNSIFLTMVILPFYAKNIRECYIYLFPLVCFFGFYVTGYYNPTYTAGFSLFCITVLAYQFLTRNHKLVVISSALILSISLFNGLSFLSTRILNHDKATFFEEEARLEALLKTMDIKVISLPERYQMVATRLNINNRFINYKSINPTSLDIFVYDNYDYEMYRFVPDFEKRQKELNKLMKDMCLLDERLLPVYKSDDLFDLKSTDFIGQYSRQGSWFFRNSVSYTLRVYTKC
jgi:hypothetical protein